MIQQDIDDAYPELEIQIIGLNEVGQEIGNVSVTANRSLPWLQDVDQDGDGDSDVWLNSWDYEYRDVVIVDANNDPVDVFNLTLHDLKDEDNYNTLMQKLVSAAQQSPTDGWTNPAEALDVSNDGNISPLDALLVINHLNDQGAGPVDELTRDVDSPFLDTNNDGFISPLDALLVLNHLNSISSVQSVAALPAILPAAESSATDPSSTSAAGLPNSLLASAVDGLFGEDVDETGVGDRELTGRKPLA